MSAAEAQTGRYRLAREQILMPLSHSGLGLTPPLQYRHLRYLAGLAQSVGDGFLEQALLDVAGPEEVAVSGLDAVVSETLQWVHQNCVIHLPLDDEVRTKVPPLVVGPGAFSRVVEFYVEHRDVRPHEKLERTLKKSFVKKKFAEIIRTSPPRP